MTNLGQEHRVTLPQGEVRYYESGSGQTVVFVHGVFTNALLWRKVVPDIAAAGFRCITPDWPLGAHEIPMHPDADLTPAGAADVIADFLEALDLRDVVLVGNDTGGALSQIMLSRRPERVARVVLLPSDSFEYFFPPIFRPLPKFVRLPGAMPLLARLLQVKALHRLPVLFGWVTKRPVPPEIADAYFTPLLRSAGVRRDVRKLLRAVDSKYTLEAAEKLRGFDRPVLLLWASEDKLFPIRLAQRLAALLPDARLVEVADAYTFIPEDKPEAVVRHVVEFAGAMAD
ncbi:alpha/beta hydrolase [Amycolatopsis sp. K13G38]|uniref:Alpha/beta hydrolase n=1 Tax=Amycolatopsis acididurans TaxID=2724524 RepID=A0ABX1J8Z6_9PSEU|nr:alpha/beta hydrolase [Amycolatopsis acididurans]NKQ55766.1 alpha/beta hydrolase [Amycolatopsis acididurans]